jgi:hypothetical protein
VTVLRAGLREVYVGTNWGFVFLADVKRLRPITFFRPFEQDVRSFWVFRDDVNNVNRTGSPSTIGGSDQENDAAGVLATLHSSTSSSNINSAQLQLLAGNDASKEIGKKESDESDESRGISPTPSQSDTSKNNLQIVLGIGKGFSNLIDKSVGLSKESKQRRRAFAMLWHMHEGVGP